MRKNTFFRMAMIMAMPFMTAACQQVEDTLEQPVQAAEDAMYHYEMQLDCEMPSFDSGADSRAVSYTSWENNATLFIRFKNGSKWIIGQAIYSASENIWNVGTYEALPTISGEETCEIYYFVGAKGSSSTAITMDERTACYMTKTGKYKHSTATSIGLSAVLDKMTWRLRFKGNAGTTISLPSNNNDINYFSSFSLTNGNFNSGAKDISLTVASDGYTPYIYGSFKNTGDNVLSVYNGTDGFSRQLSSSNLGVGESGYLNIPTTTSHNGWDPIASHPYYQNLVNDPNLYTQPNLFMCLTGGFGCDWTTGGNTKYSYKCTIKKSIADNYSDTEIYDLLISGTSTEGIEDYIVYNNVLDSDTDYYLFTLSVNTSGKHAPIYKYQFHTASENNQPLAKIRNLRAATSNGVKKWMMDITLINTSQYYIINDDRFYNEDDYFFAFCCYKWITEGQVTYTYDFEGASWNRNDEQEMAVLTWALTSSGNLGGTVSVARATTSGASRSEHSAYANRGIIRDADGTSWVADDVAFDLERTKIKVASRY